jgi:YHS domain-containing protein
MNILKNRCILFASFFFLIFNLHAAKPFETEALGANGYDLVAYQTENKAVPGNSDFYSFNNGVIYLFANQPHKDLFDKNPEKYLPAYGGYCAMAMTLGKKHPTDPQAFLVVDGKLYLNKAKVRDKWLQDIPGNIKKADAIWEKIKDTDPAKL